MNRGGDERLFPGGFKLLIAEDGAISQKTLAMLLTHWGFEVDSVFNGQEAVKKLKTGHYDICLMDINMPILDGLEATKRIRQDLKKTLPIIAVTGVEGEDIKSQCLEAGMNDIIRKPYDSDVLKTKLFSWLPKR